MPSAPTTHAPTRFFAATVEEAHARFVAACRQADASLDVFPHPLTGPAGEPLHTAVAWLGPRNASRVVAAISGVHGVEGYAGSAIQCGWLDRHAGRALPPDTAVLLVHLINPWGAAWSRRETEDNVDLFRNLAYPGPDYPRNPLYERYEPGLNPRAPNGPAREQADLIFAAFLAEHGRETVTAVVRRGQHHFPKGLTFNGAGPTWSSRLVESIAARWLADARAVDVIDIHTGYGDHAQSLFIPAAPPGSPQHQRVAAWFGDRLFQQGSVGMIPAHPRAPFDSWAHPARGRTVCSVGLELGTVDTDGDLELLRDYSCQANYGSLLSAEGARLRHLFREKFDPPSERWRATVLESGTAAIETMIRNG